MTGQRPERIPVMLFPMEVRLLALLCSSAAEKVDDPGVREVISDLGHLLARQLHRR